MKSQQEVDGIGMYSLQKSWYLIAMNPPLDLSAVLAQAILPIPWIAIALVALGIMLTSPKKEDKK